MWHRSNLALLGSILGPDTNSSDLSPTRTPSSPPITAPRPPSVDRSASWKLLAFALPAYAQPLKQSSNSAVAVDCIDDGGGLLCRPEAVPGLFIPILDDQPPLIEFRIALSRGRQFRLQACQAKQFSEVMRVYVIHETFIRYFIFPKLCGDARLQCAFDRVSGYVISTRKFAFSSQ